MRKILLLAILLLSGVHAAAAPDGTKKAGLAELYADRFESEGDKVRALGHVVLSYEGTLFLGDRASYDRKANVIVLEGNVEILSDRGSKVLADKVVFEVDRNHVTMTDFYHTDRDDIWIYADDAEKQDGNYTLRNSVLSSCSMEDPDWSVKFGEAVYDSETKYIRLKNVKIYAKEVPVLYTPYLGFSLERQRSSGLLMPHFGYSGDEGFYYEQPYFWAISPSMDMEFNPSIRTNRGYGIYGTFRFVDSPWSHGQIRTGYFKDYDSFVDEHNLVYNSHYGVEFLYESTNVLRSWKPEGYRDGLYVNLNLFNDIDYHNLQYSTLSHLEETSRFKESRINYFLYNDEQYFGIRGRYFIDTTSKENNETIQELPALQYHKYMTSFFGDSFQYSVDAQLHNYWREEGDSAVQSSFTLPVEFHTPLLKEWLNFSIEEELQATDTKFFNGTSFNYGEDHYAALVIHHKVELTSDLMRGYQSGWHMMQLGATFTKTSLMAEGDLKYEDISEELAGDFNLDLVYKTRYTLSMHHFWESYSHKFKVDYLVLADYYPDTFNAGEVADYFTGHGWNELRQELHLTYKGFRWDSRVDYAVFSGSWSEISNKISYRNPTFGFSVNHTRKEDSSPRQDIVQNDVIFDFHYKQNEKITWYGGYTYDLRDEYSKDWKAGIYYDRKCWNIKLVFKQEITPTLTEDGSGSIRNNSFLFQFNMVPFGGVGTKSFQNLSDATDSWRP
jgi:LPS-assembly protein